MLSEYFPRATKVIESHGGTVEKFIGDAVVGVFGVPVVHEDDPERAVRAGCASSKHSRAWPAPTASARGPLRREHRRGPGAPRRRPRFRPRVPHR